MTTPDTAHKGAEGPRGPLLGVKVLDIATMVAAPFAAVLLADYGADVVKVELPAVGDHIRQLPPYKDGVPLWSKVVNRNKRGITLDLRHPEGRLLFERMLPKYDVLIENFRTGTLAEWGLSRERMFEINPGLIILRITGFGQTGPYRNRPGFARVFEAASGFANLCGHADGPPIFPGAPISDFIAGIFGACAISAALVHRNGPGEGRGQEIDLSATEAMFRTLDFMAIEYDQLGVVRQRNGNLNAYSAPSDVYRTQDGHWVVLAVSAPGPFQRLATAIGRPDLISSPKFSNNNARLANREAIETIIREWFASKTFAEMADTLHAADVSVCPINTIKDIFEDPQFIAREAIISVNDAKLGPIAMQGVVPQFSQTAGHVWRTGPDLGEHNFEILRDELGLTDDELRYLADQRVI